MAFDFMKWLMGSEPEMKQAQTMNPQQQQFQQQLLGGMQQPTSSGMEWLQQLLSGEEGAFQDFEAPMMRQFEQQTVPGIAERFAGMGSGGGMDSSQFTQTMGQAGKELSESMGAMRSGLKMNAMQQLQGLMQQGQQPSFQNMYAQGDTGVVGGMLQNAATKGGEAATKYFLGK